MTQFERLKWRDKVRAKVNLLLAESNRPLKDHELYDRLIQHFNNCSFNSMVQILHANIDETYFLKGEYWSYEPCPFFTFHDGYELDEYSARAAYFRKIGEADPTKAMIEELKEEQHAESDRIKRKRASERMLPAFQMINAASAIAKSLQKHEHNPDSTNPTS